MYSARIHKSYKLNLEFLRTSAEIKAAVAFLKSCKIFQIIRKVGRGTKIRFCCYHETFAQDAAAGKCHEVIICARKNHAVKKAWAMLQQEITMLQPKKFGFVPCVDADVCAFVRGKNNKRIVGMQRFARDGTRI